MIEAGRADLRGCALPGRALLDACLPSLLPHIGTRGFLEAIKYKNNGLLSKICGWFLAPEERRAYDRGRFL